VLAACRMMAGHRQRDPAALHRLRARELGVSTGALALIVPLRVLNGAALRRLGDAGIHPGEVEVRNGSFPPFFLSSYLFFFPFSLFFSVRGLPPASARAAVVPGRCRLPGYYLHVAHGTNIFSPAYDTPPRSKTLPVRRQSHQAKRHFLGLSSGRRPSSFLYGDRRRPSRAADAISSCGLTLGRRKC